MSNPGLHIDEVNMNNVNYDDNDAWMQDLEGALAQSSPTSYSQYIHNIQPSSSITENNFQQNDAFNNLSDHLSSSTSMIVQPSASHTDIKAESCMSQNSDINTSNLNTNNSVQINQLHHQQQHQPHHQMAQQPRMQNQTQMIHHQPKQNLQPNNSNRTQQMLAKVTSQQPLLMPKVSTIQQQPQIITTYSPASQKNNQNYEQRVISFANQQQSHQIHQSQSQIVNSPNNSQNAQSSQKYNDSNTTFISPPRSISNQQPQIIQTVNGAWIQTSQLQQLQNSGGMTIVPANQNMPISIQRFAEGISVIRQSQFIQGQDGVTLIDANNLQPRFVQQAYPNSNLIQINSNDMNQAIYQTQGLNNGPQHILIENANGTQTVQQVIIAQPQGNSNMGINMMQGNNAIILQSKPGPQLPLKKVPQPRQPLQRGNGKKKESPQMIDNSVNIVAHGINSNAGNVSMISNSNMSNQRRQIGKPQLVTQKQGVQSQQISKQQVQMQKQQPHQFQRPANPQNFQNQQSTLQARLKQQPNNIPAHPANEYQVEVTPEDLAVIDTLTKQIILLKAQEQRTGKSEKAKILELEMKRGDIFLNRLGEQHVLDTKVIKDQIYASMPNAGPGAPASTSKPPPKPKAVPKRGSRAAANNESTVKNGPSTSRNHQKQTNNMGNTNIGQSSSKMNVPTTGQLAKSMQKSKQVVSNQQNAFQNDSSQFQSNAASSGMGSGVISSQLNTKNVQGSYLGGNKVNLVQNQVVVVNQPPVKYIPSSETQKKLIDNQRIIRSQQMQQLKNSFYEKTLNPDVTTPFKDIDDAFHRLIPYSVFHEAEPSKETLNLFDHDRLRLRNNHTSRITNFMDKLQSKFLKESVEPTQFKAEHLQLLHMDVEYEKRRLGSEKALANTPEVATIIDKGAAYGIRVDRLDEMHRSLKEKNGQTLASYKFHFNYDLPVNTRQYIPKDMPEGWRTPINTIFDSDNEERDYKKGLSDSDSETDDGKAGDNDNELTESICIDTNGMIDYREPPNIFQPIISPPLYGSGESKHTLSVSSISTKSSCKVKFNLTPLPSISSLSAPKLVVHRGEQIELEATPLMSSAFPPIPKLSLKKVIHPSLLTEPTPSVHSESVFVLPPLKIPKAKLNAKGTTIQHAINSLTTSIPENTSPPARYEDYDGVSTSNGCSNPIVSEKTQIPIASIGEGKVDDNESKVEDMSDKERRRQEKKVRKAKKEEKKERKRVKEMEELNNLNKSISNDSVAATNDCSIVSDSFSDAASTSQPPQRLLFRLNKSELRAEKLLPVMSTTIAAPPAVGTVPLGNEPKVKVPKLKIAREKLHLDPGNSDDSCLKIPPLIVNKPTAHATLDSHLTTHVTLAEPIRTMKEHVRSKAGEHSLLVESKPEAIVSEKKERKKSKERKTIKEPRQSKEHKREKKIKLDKSLAKAATQDDGKVNANDDAPSRLILKLSKLPKLKGEPSIATDVPSLSRSSIDSGSSSVRHKVSESPVPTSDWYKKNPNDNDNLSSVMSNSGKKDQKIKMKLSTPKPEIINVAPAVEDKNSFLSKLEPVKKHGSVVAEPDSSSSSRIDQPPIKMKISIGKKDGKGKEVHKIEEPVVEKIPSLKLSISKARLAPKSNTTPPPIEHRKRKHKETSNDGEEVNADEIERKRKKKEEKKLKKLARLQINGSLIPTE